MSTEFLKISARRALLIPLAILLGSSPFRSQAADPTTFVVGPFKFQRPANWKWTPVHSEMRKAQLEVPKNSKDETDEPAEVIFFYFGPDQGGGVDANISRWIGQFQEPEAQLKPEVDAAVVNKTKITRVRVKTGTFNSGMPGQSAIPKKEYGLIGAILESSQGNVFIKMTGPSELVNQQIQEFENMIKSGADSVEVQTPNPPKA